jgi:hypothetical protein
MDVEGGRNASETQYRCKADVSEQSVPGGRDCEVRHTFASTTTLPYKSREHTCGHEQFGDAAAADILNALRESEGHDLHVKVGGDLF